MNRIVKLVITTTATFALTSASLGQVVTINQPRVVNDEFANVTVGITASDSSTISINVPAGLDAGGAVVNTESILIDIDVLDVAGASQGAPGGRQKLPLLLVHVLPVGLEEPVGGVLEGPARHLDILQDGVDRFGCRPLGVGVLDAQHELAPGVPGIEPAEQRRAHTTDV